MGIRSYASPFRYIGPFVRHVASEARSGFWYTRACYGLKSHSMKNRPNYYNLRSGPLLSLGSAFLFGASTPVAKLLLGITDPLLLAGLLYLGSGVGLALVTAAGRSLGLVRSEARYAHAKSRGLPRSCCSAAFSARPCSCPASPSRPPRAAPFCSTPRASPRWR